MINFVTLAVHVHLLNKYITTDTVDFFIEYLHIIISRFNHFALKRENLNLRMQNFSQNHTFIQFTSVRPIKARFQILRCLLLAILHGNKFLLVMNLQKHISIFFSNERNRLIYICIEISRYSYRSILIVLRHMKRDLIKQT